MNIDFAFVIISISISLAISCNTHTTKMQQMISLQQMVKETTLYERLGVLPNAELIDIQEAFERKKIDHGVRDHTRDKITKEFKDILYAYWVLSDKRARKVYDKYGQAAVEAEGYDFSMTTTSGRRKNYCDIPEPMSLFNMTPQFTVYARNVESIEQIIRDEKELPDFVVKMKAGGLLNEKRPVIFVTHGYFGLLFGEWLSATKDLLLKRDDVTVIVVAWKKGAHLYSEYARTIAASQTISAVIAQLAFDILKSDTFDGDKHKLYLHCIGYSLGAHVCGQAGRFSTVPDQVTGPDRKLFDRVTGLDPAGPGFEKCNAGLRISNESADCVDNIHTDGIAARHFPISRYVAHLGSLHAWGHVDFYPNNGGNQPGCVLNGLPSCSHRRSVKLFLLSIDKGPDKLVAEAKCDPGVEDCRPGAKQAMGYYSSCHRSNIGNKIPGRFYIDTKAGANYFF